LAREGYVFAGRIEYVGEDGEEVLRS